MATALLALGLWACNAAPPQGAVSAPSDAGEPAAGADRNIEEALAGAVGKPVAPIGIRYELHGQPALGQPLEIAVTVTPQIAMSAFRVQFTSDEALVLDSPQEESHGDVAANTALVHTLTVTPLEEGRWRIAVLAEGEVDGRPQARSVGIPVQVGAQGAASQPRGNLKIDDSGERVISLPAEERQ